MMRAELDQADVGRNAAVISCPGFEHALGIVFGLDLGENPAVPVVNEENDNLQAPCPYRGISVMPLPTASEFARMGQCSGMTPEQMLQTAVGA